MDCLSMEENAYNELRYYTISHAAPTFIHQHVVDAWTAQHADSNTKPITLAFALVGLYLHVECGASGKQVQKVHMELARHKQSWPRFALPTSRGDITVRDVMRLQAGPERDRAIDAWCKAVWDAYHDSHTAVAALLAQHGVEPKELPF